MSDILSAKEEKHDSLYASTMDHHGVIEIIATALEKEKARSAKLIEALENLILCADAENWISDTVIHDICTQAINEYAKGLE